MAVKGNKRPRGGTVRPYNSLISVVQQVAEAAIVRFALMLAVQLHGSQWNSHFGNAAVLGMAAYFVGASSLDLYRSWRGHSFFLEVWQIGKCWLAMIFTLLLIAFITKTGSNYPRLIIGWWWVIGFFLHVFFRFGLRIALRYVRASGLNSRSAVIVGGGPLAVSLARQIADSPWLGIRVLGFYDDALPIDSQPAADLPLKVLGSTQHLPFDAHTQKYDIAYFAMPMGTEMQAKVLINELTQSATEVHYVPDIFVFNLINARIRDLGGIPTISVFESPLDSFGKLLKRAEDVVLSAVILAVIALPMLLVAIGIKLTSPGPVLFKQRRFGLHGQEIKVWKFRSMMVCEDGKNVVQASVGDPRVTRFGRFLRKTSLDELPQFFNVLGGSMSIVGPRPHAVFHNEQYRQLVDQYMLRHLVKPGITGWAQIHGWRGQTDTLDKMEQRVKFDIEYIQRWSLGLDLKIILLTIVRGFTDKNAY